MPTYVYRCSCGEERDVVHAMTEDPKVLCVVCGTVMNRKPQFGSFTLKGPGFYSTGGR